MSRKFMIALAIGTVLFSGCATQSIQQSINLSASGITYTEAVDKLLDVTTDRIIDFDNAVLEKTRGGSNPRKMITEKNEALLSVLGELGRFRMQTKLLKTYFINLQALADSPVKDDAGGAVQSLSDSIDKLNKAIGGKDVNGHLTEDQITQISALGGLTADNIHGAKVKCALERDAEIVGTYLALQENQIANITDMLENRFLAENDLFLNEKVISPYIDMDKSLDESWAKDRKEWAKRQVVSEQLVTVKEAAKQLRGIWSDILEGKTDINSISVLILNVNEFITAVQALESENEAN